MRLDDAFREFYKAIELGAIPEGRMADSWNRLQNYLVSKYGMSAAKVFLQGSYANDTTIKPQPGGEYDLDVVTETAKPGASADDALKDLIDVLSKDADYKKRIDVEKQPRPCVRIRYADDEDGGRFHVDVVPARVAKSAPLEIPVRSEGWRDTNPRGYTTWCKSLGDNFKRTVRMMKRWRDENQDTHRGIKSIVLQVLVAEALPTDSYSDAERVVLTFEGIQSRLAAHPNTPPDIFNPVLVSEDLAKRWSGDSYRAFRADIDDAVKTSREAFEDSDESGSHVKWRTLFGDDFPPPPTSPSKRYSVPPAPPAPGYESRPQQPARRERYA